MTGACFQTLNVAQFLHLVEDLHGRVSQRHGRIEITADGCEDACVLISKAELESLERALEILAGTREFQSMCQIISELVTGEQTESAQITGQ